VAPGQSVRVTVGNLSLEARAAFETEWGTIERGAILGRQW